MSYQLTLNKNKVLLILFAIAFIASIILTIIPTPVICNPDDGCEVVQTSKYAQTFGIKNSIFGIIAFGILIILTYLELKHPKKSRKQLINIATTIGFLIAMWFIYVQASILNAWCKYCMVADVAAILAFLVIIFWKK